MVRPDSRPESGACRTTRLTPRACSRPQSGTRTRSIFLENEILYGQSFDVPKMDDFVLPIGKARIHKQGKDVTHGILRHRHDLCASRRKRNFAGWGWMSRSSTCAPSARWISDTVIASVKKTNRLVVVEEGFPQSSVGDFIANQVSQRAFDFLDAPVITVAGKDVPMPYAANLEKLALPNVRRGNRRR